MKPSHKLTKKQSGLAMVEFAVVLPFLLLTLVISGELGYLLFQQNQLYKSVATGGRFISATTTTGAGFTDLNAQDIQNTRNIIIYGNIAGTGTPLINDLKAEDININCSFGVKNGHCVQNGSSTAITLQLNYEYEPVMGEMFDSVTGFNFFPFPLSAITIVETI